MEQILTELTPLIQKLSEIFCVSVDFIQQNFMSYVMMYGKYHFWSNIFVKNIAVSILATLISVMVFLFITGLIFEKEISKKHCKTLAIICATTFVITFIITILPYIMCPEIYSIQAVLSLIK